MTTAFSASSRLANFRDKKNSVCSQEPGNENNLKLTLPENQDKSSYEPTATFNNSRTNMRLLKGRIEKGKSIDKQNELTSDHLLTEAPKLSLNEKEPELKLVINDSPKLHDKKVVNQQQPQNKPTQKRILIAKEQPKEEPQQKVVEIKKEPTPPPVEKPKEQPSYFNPHDEKPIIKEEQIEQSKEQGQIENQNDLVLCPQGCGRKFNRRALQKHVKACKLVFMSKRKEFNSEAKRLTSKEQANIVRQNKLKQKTQLGKTKTKGFDKTSDNWKAASEDFRSAIKAIKKDENEGEEGNEEAALVTVNCQFCDKKFAQALLEKHLENCQKKKEKEEKEKKKNKKK